MPTDLKETSKKYLTIIGAVIMLPFASCSINSSSQSVNESVTFAANEEGLADTADEITITMAIVGDPVDSFRKAIEDFNSADNGYKIELRSFLDNYDDNGEPIGFTNEEVKQVDFQVIQEIINTSNIDIVGGFSFINESNYYILMKKGAFVNLYDFMKEDNDVNPDLLNRHILELSEIDGCLYTIPQYYKAESMLGKAEYVGDKQNWSIDEFLDHWDKMPDDTTISGNRNAETICYELIRPNLSSFVDYSNASVNFDSYDFRKMLEFCDQFDSTNGQKVDLDYSAPNFISKFEINGFSAAVINTINPISKEQSYSHISDGDYTIVGFPSSDGEGSYLTGSGINCSICKTSSKEKQHAAWEFIRQFYTEEYQQEHVIERYENVINGEVVVSYSSEFGFCINNAARIETAEKICGGDYYSGTYESKGQTYEILLPNKDDCDFIDNYISSINRWEYGRNNELWDIVKEEVVDYLGGDQDINRTIDMIQSRSAILVGEKS